MTSSCSLVKYRLERGASTCSSARLPCACLVSSPSSSPSSSARSALPRSTVSSTAPRAVHSTSTPCGSWAARPTKPFIALSTALRSLASPWRRQPHAMRAPSRVCIMCTADSRMAPTSSARCAGSPCSRSSAVPRWTRVVIERPLRAALESRISSRLSTRGRASGSLSKSAASVAGESSLASPASSRPNSMPQSSRYMACFCCALARSVYTSCSTPEPSACTTRSATWPRSSASSCCLCAALPWRTSERRRKWP
mmetsp:Transcript_6961/g.20837  ORF Transcript_6961/g.20837 Transcript_6961/m.20837 type:complete len:254 (-) Transcript_6961:309-1070(-)